MQVKVESRTHALDMRDDAKELASTGKNVVVFFDTHYHMYLAPGYDPYQIRSEVDQFINPTEIDGLENTKKKSGKKTSTKVVDEKIESTKEPAKVETEEKSSKKKSFWDSLK